MNVTAGPDSAPLRPHADSPAVDTCAVVGLGLIGGSFALRLLQQGVRVHGWDPDEGTRAAAAEAGVVVAESTAALPATDLALLAGPTSVVAAQLRSGDLPRARVLIDACSAKGVVAEAAAAGAVDHLVPCHPMAGTEHSGFTAAAADLLDDAVWVMTPSPGQQIDHVRTALTLIVQAFSSRVAVTSPSVHDEAVAAISHVPHASAQALVRGVQRSAHADLTAALAAGSFHDATRVVRGDVDKTVELLTQNRHQVIAQLGALTEDLAVLRGWLSGGQDEQVRQWFAHPLRPSQDELTLPLATSADLAALLRAGTDGYLVTAVSDALRLAR